MRNAPTSSGQLLLPLLYQEPIPPKELRKTPDIDWDSSGSRSLPSQLNKPDLLLRVAQQCAGHVPIEQIVEFVRLVQKQCKGVIPDDFTVLGIHVHERIRRTIAGIRGHETRREK